MWMDAEGRLLYRLKLQHNDGTVGDGMLHSRDMLAVGNTFADDNAPWRVGNSRVLPPPDDALVELGCVPAPA